MEQETVWVAYKKTTCELYPHVLGVYLTAGKAIIDLDIKRRWEGVGEDLYQSIDTEKHIAYVLVRTEIKSDYINKALTVYDKYQLFIDMLEDTQVSHKVRNLEEGWEELN